MLSNARSFNLHKARFPPRLPLLSQPTLKIKQAHSLATAKLHSRQSALPIQSDNSCLLLRAEAPTRPPAHFILSFHAQDYPKSRRPSNSWLCLCGYFTGTEEALPKLCELLNNLQDEIERAGHTPGR
jgi:hypothetical protein